MLITTQPDKPCDNQQATVTTTTIKVNPSTHTTKRTPAGSTTTTPARSDDDDDGNANANGLPRTARTVTAASRAWAGAQGLSVVAGLVDVGG